MIEYDASKEYAITTYDNAFDPFTDFKRWWKEDILLGHDTCGTLARVANTCSIASDEINSRESFRAMVEMVNSEPTLYKILSRDYNSVFKGNEPQVPK